MVIHYSMRYFNLLILPITSRPYLDLSGLMLRAIPVLLGGLVTVGGRMGCWRHWVCQMPPRAAHGKTVTNNLITLALISFGTTNIDAPRRCRPSVAASDACLVRIHAPACGGTIHFTLLSIHHTYVIRAGTKYFTSSAKEVS